MRLSSSNSLTEGSLPRGILLFSLPLILSNILQVLFNMSDIAVVGQFAGSHALGSVGSTTIIVALFTNILIGVGAGVNVVVARYIGAKEDKNVSDTVHSSALICLLCGLALMMIGLLINRPLLELMGTKEELIDGAELYLRIYFCGMPALAIYNFGNGVLSASGNTGKPLVYMLIAGILNVILNLFFVIGFSLDVAGVAIASILSQYVSAVLVLSALLRSNEVYAFRFAKLRFTKDKAKQVALLGISTGLQNAIFQAANLFVQAGVNSFDATTVEGNSAATNARTCIRRYGGILRRLLQLHESKFRRTQEKARPRQLFHQHFLCSCDRTCHGRRHLSCGRAFFTYLYQRRCCCKSGHGTAFGHGALIRVLGVDGRRYCRLARTRQKRRTDGYRYYGLVRFPNLLGLYRFCSFRNDPIAVSSLYQLVDHHGDRGAFVLPLCLQKNCFPLARLGVSLFFCPLSGICLRLFLTAGFFHAIIYV